MLGLEIVQGVETWHVLDARGRLVSSHPSRNEAVAFVAGYRTGRADAAQIVHVQAEQLARVGG